MQAGTPDQARARRAHPRSDDVVDAPVRLRARALAALGQALRQLLRALLRSAAAAQPPLSAPLQAASLQARASLAGMPPSPQPW
jgi:hypothetical protein